MFEQFKQIAYCEFTSFFNHYRQRFCLFRFVNTMVCTFRSFRLFMEYRCNHTMYNSGFSRNLYGYCF